MNQNLNEIFAYNLKAKLKERKKDPSQLAMAIGINRTTVYTWLNADSYPRSSAIQKVAEYLHCTTEELITDNRKTGAYKIPVLGSVIAGIPIEAIQDIIDYEEIPSALASTGEFFALQIKGDSMEPEMRAGDIVIVRKQETIENGQIGIVLVNGDEATVKQVFLKPEGLELVGFNPSFQPLVFMALDIINKPVKIIGRVIECRKKY